MALTYGFYNSLDGDRKYSAKQFGAIFDGIIRDGVYSTIGNRLVVKASGNGFQVNIQTGRAWFNHTWTLNDAIYALSLPSPEPLLNKYVAVVLEVNEEQGQRRNSFKTVEGTPSSNPQYPALVKTEAIHQYPLAYCLVKAGATAITQAEIVNMVGTSSCPYVTGVLTSFDIDELIAQWKSQWQQFLSADTTQWNNFINDKSSQWTQFMNSNTAEFESFISDFQTFLSNCNTSFSQLLEDKEDELDQFIDDKSDEVNQFVTTEQGIFNTWFDRMKDQLSEDAAGHLQEEIDGVKGVVLTGTLLAGETTIDISDMSIDDDALIDVYTDVYGVNPIDVSQNNHTVTLEFREQQDDIGIKLIIRKEE